MCKHHSHVQILIVSVVPFNILSSALWSCLNVGNSKCFIFVWNDNDYFVFFIAVLKSDKVVYSVDGIWP